MMIQLRMQITYIKPLLSITIRADRVRVKVTFTKKKYGLCSIILVKMRYCDETWYVGPCIGLYLGPVAWSKTLLLKIEKKWLPHSKVKLEIF